MQLLLHCGKLLGQGLQDIGGRFKVAFLLLQPCDGNGEWLPVEIAEIRIFAEP